MREPDRHVPTVAELVNQLFDVRRRADGTAFSNREVGLALRKTNPGAHIAKIRNGEITNPTRETLLVVCRFFHVDPSYFFPELAAEGVVVEPLPNSYAAHEQPSA